MKSVQSSDEQLPQAAAKTTDDRMPVPVASAEPAQIPVTVDLSGETGTHAEFRPITDPTGDTLGPENTAAVVRTARPLVGLPSLADAVKSVRGEKMLTFDLHPLYGSILQDGAQIRRGEVLGLDGDLRRVLVAPFDGIIRLLVTGTGNERRVRVYLSEHRERRETFAAGRR
ncbi:MAG: hypothetical protein SFU56_13725 [Capsulimonadales bacterium]|nr:hypothetical protein [Capsulimonadales bacterium]